MTKLPTLRSFARLWFASALFSALVLGFLTLTAQAQVETQTQTGGPTPPAGRGHETIIDQSVPTSGQISINLSQQVAARAEREGQWVRERQVEVERLEDGLVISDSHTVILDGDGKTGVVEEFARQNPQDMVISLNNDHLINLNEQDSASQLKAELTRLAQMAGRNQPTAGGTSARVIFHIPDLKLLMKGAILSPLDAVWDRIGANKNLYFIIESRPEVTEEAFKRAKLPAIKDGIIRQKLMPASLAAVTEYAGRVAQELEAQRKVSISTEGVETAARLAVGRLGETGHMNLNTTGVFQRVAKLLNQTATVLLRRQRGNVSGAAETKGQVLALERLEKSLVADLEHEPNNSALQQRLDKVRSDLQTARMASSNATTSNNLHLELAKIELQLAEANMIVDGEKAKKTRWSSKTEAHKKAEADVERLTRAKLDKELELATASDKDGKPAKRVGKPLVLEVAANWLGVKAPTLENNFEDGLRNIGNINKTVFGQDHVIEAIRGRLVLRATHLQEGKPVTSREEAEAIKRGETNDHARPLASFWFGGETGVGKTETTVQLAQELGFNYHRFDMSEFMHDHNVARFWGSPPGYVGFGEPGQLIDLLEKNPESVIVFDEIEKAHPKIQNILLQLLDFGEITSADGKKKVSAKRAIIVLTSNAGQKISNWNRGQLVEFLTAKGEGQPGWSIEKIKDTTQMDINRLRSEVYKLYVKNPMHLASEGLQALRGEFVGRIDEVSVFNQLQPDVVMKITQKSVKDVIRRMAFFHNVEVRLTPKSMAALAGMYNGTEGARSMRRAIDRMIRMPLAEGIIGQQTEQKINSGDSVVIDVGDDGKFVHKVNTAAELATALQSENSSSPAADEMRARIDARKRPAFAATMELVRRVVSPEIIIPEHAFGRFRRR